MADRNTVIAELKTAAKFSDNIRILINGPFTNDSNYEVIKTKIGEKTLSDSDKSFLKLIILTLDENELQKYYDEKWEIFYDHETNPLITPIELKEHLIFAIGKLSQFKWSERLGLIQVFDPGFNVAAPPAKAVGGGKRRTRTRRQRQKLRKALRKTLRKPLRKTLRRRSNKRR
jgi:hypothetical protein